MFLLQLRATDGSRPHHLSKGAQHLCIDSIGLGHYPSRSYCRTRLACTKLTFSSAPTSACTNARSVSSTRFTNHLHWPFELFNPLDQLSMTNALISKTTFLIPNCPVQIRLGHINSQIDKLLFHVIKVLLLLRCELARP